MATTERGQELIVWMVIFTILVTFSMVGRFWAFTVQKRPFRADDFLVILAFLCLLGIEGPVFYSHNNTLGAHYDELTLDQATLLHKIQLSTGVTWTLATCSCKAAVLWMYLSIFPSRNVQFAVHIGIGLSAAYAVAFIPVFMTICFPLDAMWSADIEFVLSHCRVITTQEFASVAANMALDLMVVIIPMPALWKLKLRTTKKVFVMLMFSFGLAVVGVSAWRIVSTVESTKTIDWSCILMDIALQSHLEVWLGIIAANLPMMSPVLTRLIMPAVSGEITPNKGGQSNETGKRRRDFEQINDGSESMEIPRGSIESRDTSEQSIRATRELSANEIRRDIEIRVDSSRGKVETHHQYSNF